MTGNVDPSKLPLLRADTLPGTGGKPPAVERYTAEGHPYRLILSLTSAFQDKREALVPVGRQHAVADLAAAMRRHALRRGGPVNLAWVLMAGGGDEARELGRLFAGVPVRLSVIDVSDPSGRFQQASEAERGAFLAALARHGIGFVRRYSGGPDIHAACGMLAGVRRGGEVLSPGT